jgi:small conductance mechanosensitive channel
MDEMLDLQGVEKNVEQISRIAIDFLVNYSFQVIGAIFILLAGIVVSRWVARLAVAMGERRDIDVTLRMFLGNIARLVVLGLFVVVALGNFGIKLTPLVAAIGAAAFGLTLALQGPVSNFGAGIAIILGRPFTVGNTIMMNDISGIVEEVKLSATILATEDGEKITIPNKHIIGEILTNSFEYNVVEGCVGIDYSSDPEAAIAIVRRSLEGVEGVAQDPPPQIGIQGFGDSSIDIGMRYWVQTHRYYPIQYAANLAAFKDIVGGGIEVPYPPPARSADPWRRLNPGSILPAGFAARALSGLGSDAL